MPYAKFELGSWWVQPKAGDRPERGAMRMLEFRCRISTLPSLHSESCLCDSRQTRPLTHG